MTWTNLTFSFGAVLTSAQMTNLDNNFEAMAAGDAGAPSIVNAALGAACVTQSKISTATASGSVSMSGQSVSYALAGGTYSFWTGSSSATSSESSAALNGAAFSTGNAAAGVIGIGHIGSTSFSGSFFIDERYVQASPPYGDANEDWPLFVYVMRRIADGVILSASVSPDPTWAYHGPTNIQYDFKDVDGRLKKKIRAADFGQTKLSKEILKAIKTKNLAKQDELFAKYASSPIIEVEVTKEYKNSDMDTHPHPWMGNDLTGFEIILLEPRRTERLYMLHMDGESIRDLVLADNISIQGDAPGHLKPVGVRCCEFKFS